MTRLRTTIARRLKEAQNTAAMLTTFNEVDMSHVMALRSQYKDLEDKVGVFEGAGYAAKGLYRPQMDCLMITNTKIQFCAVCRKAIADMMAARMKRALPSIVSPECPRKM